MTRAELRAEVRLCIKRDSNGFADAYINTRLDWAQEDIGLVRDWTEMMREYSFPLTVSTSTYSWPTRMKNVYTLRINTEGGVKVLRVDPRSFDTSHPRPDISGTGDPSLYNDYGDRFQLHVIPGTADTAYIKCSIMPTPFTGDTMTSDLVRKDRLMIALATMFCYEALQEPELASAWRRLTEEAYTKAMEGDRKPKDWIPLARPFRSPSQGRVGDTWPGLSPSIPQY